MGKRCKIQIKIVYYLPQFIANFGINSQFERCDENHGSGVWDNYVGGFSELG